MTYKELIESFIEIRDNTGDLRYKLYLSNGRSFEMYYQHTGIYKERPRWIVVLYVSANEYNSGMCNSTNGIVFIDKYYYKRDALNDIRDFCDTNRLRVVRINKDRSF